MQKQKKSASAIFMYAVIAAAIIISSVCFWVYYGKILPSSTVLWIGVVTFMIMYHFWVRLIVGYFSKSIKINMDHWWFKEKSFEKKLYKFLRVKQWKKKVPTYNPDHFSVKDRTLVEIVTNMTQAEVDHWLNQLISLSSMLFALLWGEAWIFIITAIAAMLFDGQFIIIQRFNRPRLLRLIRKSSAGA